MKKTIALILSLVMMISLVACGSKNSTTPALANETAKTEQNAQTEPVKNDTNGTTDEKKFEGVTLKAFVSYGNIENAFADFTEKTGIKVEFTPLSTGAALAKLNAEEGKSDVDVWLGGGADSYIAAKDKNYLYQYVPEGAKDIDEMFKDKDGYWTAVSFQTAGIIVNNEVLKKLDLPAPKSWEDLTNPIYKGEIIFANPAISGTAYSMVETMYQNWGEEKTYDYLTRLNENVAYYTEGGGEPSKKVAAGEFAIGFVPVTGEYYNMQDESPVSIIIPEDIFPWIPSPVAIFQNSKNIEAAKVFADYFTSKEGGDSLQKAEVRIMSRNDVEMPEIMKDATKDSFVPVDMAKMAENRDKVLKKFSEIAGTKAPAKK
ncbi:MAG: ABC transporter substrate-binding protein [Sedimentibacter sp.]|uniref:ABC transporter substrate-binding protein n=1 Tax=Sedimentibacter sp. TaxID=1960295 RepID=UPI003158A34A